MPEPLIDYRDIQGTILRGYRVDLARHFILSITDAKKTAALIGALVDGKNGLPAVTTAARWKKKPECFLNLGFTASGLTTLGVTSDQLKTFDAGFQRGAAASATATIVGDIGESAPQNWVGGMSDLGPPVHIVLSIWVAKDPKIVEDVTAKLRAAFVGCVTELSALDAHAMPDDQIHFSYRDSIAQPTIKGAPPRKHAIPDDQPAVETGEFLLGYTNQGGGIYSVQPPQLSKNGSYAAFRMLEQDVLAFNAFLAEYAAKAKIDVETLAAKVCGRWRNGNPLVLEPDAPGTPLPDNKINDFTYVTADEKDDTLGLKCPVGSHIRRNNPRNEAIIGTDSAHHRIVRRAMPYGPPNDDVKPGDPPRGLIGYFINASITNQFEFLTGQWNLLSSFVKSVNVPSDTGNAGNPFFNITGEDVFLGVNDPKSTTNASSFTLAALGKKGKNNTTLIGFSRMIITRGSVYVFLPGICGLRYLAGVTCTDA